MTLSEVTADAVPEIPTPDAAALTAGFFVPWLGLHRRPLGLRLLWRLHRRLHRRPLWR